MRSVTFSMAVSLDGYIVGPDGGIDWATPDDEVFRFCIDEIRGAGKWEQQVVCRVPKLFDDLGLFGEST